MFEAIVLACLVDAPDICRERLLPGYEAAEASGCEAALQTRPPLLEEDPSVSLAAPRCAAAGPVLPVTEIAPGVFVHEGRIAEPAAENGGDIANLGFILGADGVAVIDAGTTPAIAEALWRSVRARTDLPVSHLILTHMHPDHALGAAIFGGTGAQVVGHEALARALADRQENYLESLAALLGLGEMIGAGGLPVQIAVTGTQEIDLGGRVLRLDAWPVAHTGTDLTVLDEATGTLFTGDLVFDEHTPALDGSLRGWRAVLDGLEALAPERIVPGHGGPVLAVPGGLAPLRRYLAVLEADTRAALDAGTRLGDAVETIAASEASAWQLFEAFNARNATVAYTELEWE